MAIRTSSSTCAPSLFCRSSGIRSFLTSPTRCNFQAGKVTVAVANRSSSSHSRVRVWRRRGEVFPLALKGRIWLAANSYDLLHMETDLRDPIEKLMLVRDHLVIDYGPVTFERGNEKLWLPWRAEMFMELHGKRYHHRHTLTNYLLFSVDTTNQIGRPKEAPAQPEIEQKP